MHDHTKRGRQFCPLMREWCQSGWTVSMGFVGEGEEKIPKLGVCAFWQPVSLVDNKTQQVDEIFDCAHGWQPDLITELSGRIGLMTASVDKTANEVAKAHGTQIALASDEEKQNLLKSDPRRKMLPGHKEQPIDGLTG